MAELVAIKGSEMVEGKEYNVSLYPHKEPSLRRMREGDLIVNEVGMGCSDIYHEFEATYYIIPDEAERKPGDTISEDAAPADNVSHPSHYANGWLNENEVINLTSCLDFDKGNAIKYIARSGSKDAGKEREDLEKAMFYIKHYLDNMDEIKEAISNRYGKGVRQ